MASADPVADEIPPRRPRGWLTAIAVGAVGLAAGVLVAVVLPADRAPDSDSVEAGFARDMIAHHERAVEMGEILRTRPGVGQDVERLAGDIVLTQQAQIGQLRGWMDVWGVPETGSAPRLAWTDMPVSGAMPGMASSEQLDELAAASGVDAEILFLQLMIPHHRAALDMARSALERSDNPLTRRFAEAVIAAQAAEIETMQQMLADRGSTEAPNDQGQMDMDMEMPEP